MSYSAACHHDEEEGGGRGDQSIARVISRADFVAEKEESDFRLAQARGRARGCCCWCGIIIFALKILCNSVSVLSSLGPSPVLAESPAGDAPISFPTFLLGFAVHPGLGLWWCRGVLCAGMATVKSRSLIGWIHFPIIDCRECASRSVCSWSLFDLYSDSFDQIFDFSGNSYHCAGRMDEIYHLDPQGSVQKLCHGYEYQPYWLSCVTNLVVTLNKARKITHDDEMVKLQIWRLIPQRSTKVSRWGWNLKATAISHRREELSCVDQINCVGRSHSQIDWKSERRFRR